MHDAASMPCTRPPAEQAESVQLNTECAQGVEAAADQAAKIGQLQVLFPIPAFALHHTRLQLSCMCQPSCRLLDMVPPPACMCRQLALSS
jgi:hypothetical protein